MIVFESAPSAVSPALGIQAAFLGSPAALGGATAENGFELLGNLSWLLGTANAQLGTANSAVSPSSLAGSPLTGTVFARTDPFTEQTTGQRAAQGLSHPAPGDRETPLPEQMLIPPDQDWFEPLPQQVEAILPSGNVLVPSKDASPIRFLRIAPPQLDTVNDQIIDALSAQLPEGVRLREENIEMAEDEEQVEEERSGMSAAAALLSCGVGAYWSVRDRRTRRVAAVLPEMGEEMEAV